MTEALFLSNHGIHPPRLPIYWFVGAVSETKYWVLANSCFISATVVHWHKWSLFSACALLSTSCSLCKRVCPHQLASSSDYLGLLLCPCWWNLWVKLTTAARVYNSYTAVLTARGYCLTPLFLCYLGGMNHSSSLMRKFLGSLVNTSSSLPTFLECLGKLEGRMLRLGLKHSLDGLLHRTRAIGGACCFLHKALFPHPIPSYTPLESSYSWGCLLTCPLKNNNTLLRIFVGQGWKNITFFLVQQAQSLGDIASIAVLDIQGWQLWR